MPYCVSTNTQIDPYPVAIGLDGGGTKTRAICADMNGNILARATGGASHPGKNPDAERDVSALLAELLGKANRSPEQVRACVAGLAGFNATDDLTWARPLLTRSGITENIHCVNDAVVAWAGAFCLEPGIVAIGGTGAIVLGVTEDGRHVRDYDFRHYGDLRARDLAAAVVHRIVIGDATPADDDLVATIYDHFEVDNQAALSRLASTNGDVPRAQFIREYGELAPIVTVAAGQGIPLARQVCDEAVEVTAVSIRLVGSQFDTRPIQVGLIGSVLETPYVSERLSTVLARNTVRDSARISGREFVVVRPQLSPEAGATLMALAQRDILLSQDVIERLTLVT